jgi:mannose-6-phosphate isomerase-like protein (cupin superfamily)
MGKRMTVLGPGEGNVLSARGSLMAFKATARQTSGDFSLMERTLPPGGRRPPAHRHTTCSEAFFVLDGAVGVELAGAVLTAQSGDFVLIPRGAAHTFGNIGVGEARLLVLHAPAMDAYFAELHELWAGDEPPSVDQEREVQSRYGMEPA